jgi:hypothetical protein
MPENVHGFIHVVDLRQDAEELGNNEEQGVA